MAIGTISLAARMLVSRMPVDGPVVVEHSFENCMLDVCEKLTGRDIDGLLAIGDRLMAGTYFSEDAADDAPNPSA